MSTLKNKVVVVVGGARGIGLAVAEKAQHEGADVVVLDVAAERLASLAGRGLRTMVVDVNDADATESAFAKLAVCDHVYVAAGSTRLGALLDGSLDDQLQPLRTRLFGSATVLRASARRVRPGGSVTLTGGISTDRPVPGAWVSSVATAATEQLARAMAMELAPLRVNAVAPGWTDTPMWDDVLGANKANVFKDVAKQQLTGRLGTADEVAEAVLFLMRNGAVTGEVVHIDGGRRLT